MPSQSQSPPTKPPKRRKIFAIFWLGYSMSLEGPPERGTKQTGQIVVNVIGSLLATALVALLAWMAGCTSSATGHRKVGFFTKEIQADTLIASSTVSEWDSDILKKIA